MKKELRFIEDFFEINYFYAENLAIPESDASALFGLICAGFSSFKEAVLGDKQNRFVLNINLVNDEEIIHLNSEFRNKKSVTDVLSFPLQENIRSGQYDSFNGELELGDIFICYSVCKKQAIEFELSFEDEFIHLCTHGFLHLLGFDHEVNKEEENLMEDHEVSIISEISKLKRKKSEAQSLAKD